MLYTPYSWSKISTYTQCPRKFKYQYIDKLPTQHIPSIHLDRGKLVHLIFEMERDIEKIKVHHDFKEILTNNLLQKDGIKDCFKIYDDFCASGIGKKITNMPRVFAELPLGLEHDLNITKYDASDVFLRGYIDDARHLEETDDVLITNDWKTGKLVLKEDQKWGQLLYYSIGLFSRSPVSKILLNYVYVEHNKINSKIVKREDIDKYKTALYTTVNTIEQDTTFQKEESGLCQFCDYASDCLSINI